MNTCFEIGISMDTWADENNENFNVYQVTLNVTGEYGCTSPWKKDLFDACEWCIQSVYKLAGDEAYVEALDQFASMFPKHWERFALPF